MKTQNIYVMGSALVPAPCDDHRLHSGLSPRVDSHRSFANLRLDWSAGNGAFSLRMGGESGMTVHKSGLPSQLKRDRMAGHFIYLSSFAASKEMAVESGSGQFT